jgi:hypothetical protein
MEEFYKCKSCMGYGFYKKHLCCDCEISYKNCYSKDCIEHIEKLNNTNDHLFSGVVGYYTYVESNKSKWLYFIECIGLPENKVKLFKNVNALECNDGMMIYKCKRCNGTGKLDWASNAMNNMEM